MTELRIPPPQNNYEHSLSFITDAAERVEHTYGRFNLAFDKNMGEDFVVHGSDETHKRYLVTKFGRKTEDTTESLLRSGVEHLKVVHISDGNCVFEVPLDAKPLLGERLFPDRQSDDTYISDEELFSKVGKLWGSVYRATGYLPNGTVLAHTGMREFTGEGEMIFPVPPYSDYREISDAQKAVGMFESSIIEELQAGYPRSSVDLIVEAAGISFQRGIENGSGTS